MQAALESAVPLGGNGEELVIADARGDIEQLVILRHELARLRSLLPRLSPDQQLALACQLGYLEREELCGRLGWSAEKYRKVGQRGRARLRRLMAEDQVDVPFRGPGSEQGRDPL